MRYGDAFVPKKIIVSFDVSSSTTMGEAYYMKEIIKLNFDEIYPLKHIVLRKIFAHEFAHLVCYKLYGDRIPPHGDKFNEVSRFLGGYEGAIVNLEELAKDKTKAMNGELS